MPETEFAANRLAVAAATAATRPSSGVFARVSEFLQWLVVSRLHDYRRGLAPAEAWRSRINEDWSASPKRL